MPVTKRMPTTIRQIRRKMASRRAAACQDGKRVDSRRRLGLWLESLHRRFNKRKYLFSDPLLVLYRYEDPADREVAGLIASSLAYGNVRSILRGVDGVLRTMGPSPSRYLHRRSPRCIKGDFSGFRYRVTSDGQMIGLLLGARSLLKEHGTLRESFLAQLLPQDTDTLGALGLWVDRMTAGAGAPLGHLLAHPGRGSACKRLNLYLRWMVRHDAIDPGGWEEVGAHRLIAPVDTHMHQMSLALGWTRRRQANLRTALEVTQGLRRYSPKDPLRYDFALTRPGILRLDVQGPAEKGPTPMPST